MNKIRVFLSDDHSILREGLKQILEESEDLTVVGEASNGTSTLKKLNDVECDVLILDIAMPGFTGIDVLKRLADLHSHLPVLILSMYPADQYAVRLLKSGAKGYMTKEAASDELVKAVKQIALGKRYLSSEVMELLSQDALNNNQDMPHDKLSTREFQVLCHIASGKTVSEIAEILSLSVKTISTYRTRILGKMNLKTNAELTNYGLKNHLIKL
ncbi:MAG: response regulator transcription factor [Candidatus Thiodiazotropha taylori]|nr:response regulator transcription factor [Candidatus Thiodiazotropha taylori]